MRGNDSPVVAGCKPRLPAWRSAVLYSRHKTTANSATSSMIRETFSAMRDFPRLREISAIMIRHGMGDLIQRLGIPGMWNGQGSFCTCRSILSVKTYPAPVRVRQALRIWALVYQAWASAGNTGGCLSSRVDHRIRTLAK